MHGLPILCPFNFPTCNLKQQWSRIGDFICYIRILMQKKIKFADLWYTPLEAL